MLASVTFAESDEEEVPYSTREFDGSLVVQLMIADVLPGVATTDEITGGVVSLGAGFTITVAVPTFVTSATLIARIVTV
jgi:hypothetical protein